MCSLVFNLKPQKPQASVTTAMDALKVVASLPGAAKAAARHMMHVSEDCLYLNVYTPIVSVCACVCARAYECLCTSAY